MKLNNKGFTVVELIVSFSFVVVILASMFAIVINYDNEADKENIKSQLLVFKNTILQITYQDIIADNTKDITTCSGNSNYDTCVSINFENGNKYELKKIKENNSEYIEYHGNKYLLPDSDIGLSTIDKFIFESDLTNKIYKITIPIIHAELDDSENNNNNKIEIILSGKKLS